ncbi:MAG: hypothetical protein M1824_005480 [Vezdaea acicularis]|nr:MAG: hypothetical protein M1824_005480 [Vezdaea acicularis]
MPAVEQAHGSSAPRLEHFLTNVMPGRNLFTRTSPSASSSSLLPTATSTLDPPPPALVVNSSNSNSIRRPSFTFHHHNHHLHLLDEKRGMTHSKNSLAKAIIARPNGAAAGQHHKDKHHHHSPAAPPAPASLAVLIESPPLILHGTPTSSTGALLSGQLQISVSAPTLHITSLHTSLQAITTTKKPVEKSCADCATRTNTLHEWHFLAEPHTLHRGTHTFPFSFLLPGHLPATTTTPLGSIAYALATTTTLSPSELIPVLQHTTPLTLSRAIPPGPDKTSIRIFPPTALTAHLTLPSHLHPTGPAPDLTLRLSGIVSLEPTLRKTWRLRKLSWRLEETHKFLSPACAAHSPKLGGAGKGILHTETHTLASGEVRSGWKTDLDTPPHTSPSSAQTLAGQGTTELTFPFPLPPLTSRSTRHQPLCSVDAPPSLTITHSLHLELVVAEEYNYHRTPSSVTPTGAARVLRMQFGAVLTERDGGGVSWDEEMPPVYGDVPASPPGYGSFDEGEVGEV